MDNIGSVHPSDLAEWTNPRGTRKGESGKVMFREESINWMMAELIKRGMANEPDVPRSDYSRAKKHLEKAFNDNNDKTKQFCKMAHKFMNKNPDSCKVTWMDDGEKLFKDRQKSATLDKSQNKNDYCSCIVHNLNPRTWTKTAFDDRTKCPQ